MSNYPDDVSPNDPRAPWNAKDPVYEECDECAGTGFNGHDCGEDTCCCLNPSDNMECETCSGEGKVEVEDEL